MSELDTMGRHHAEVVRSTFLNTEPPPIDSIASVRPGGLRRGPLVALAVAAAVVAALLPLAILSNQPDRSVPETPVATPPVQAPQASTTIPADPITLIPFDLEEFMWAKLGGVFGDTEDHIGVVVLVPARSESELEEVVVLELEELEGYSHASPDQVATAAESYASTRDMEDLEGDWVAYGLIPRFADSPVDAWEQILGAVPGAVVSRVDYRPPPSNLPEEWTVITELPFAVADGALVEAVGSDVVVVGPESSWLITPDGAWVAGEETPMAISRFCCGDAQGIAVPGSLVVLEESTVATWLLDIETMTWRRAGPRPAPGYMLGSALVEGELLVVTAADRTTDAISLLASLDLESGEWDELEPLPTPISVGGVTSDRDRLFVAGTRQGPNNNILGPNLVYEYTAATGWKSLPDNPISGQASTVIWVDGVGLVSWNYDLETALLDDSGEWHALDDVPMDFSECYPRTMTAEGGAVALCGGIAWFDAASRQWAPIRSPDRTRVTATPTALIGLVEMARDQTQMLVHPLPP